MSNLAIVGAGAWGTALAIHSLRVGHKVTLVARNKTTSNSLRLNGENPHLPGLRLPADLFVTDEIPSETEIAFWAVPTQHMRSTILRLRSDLIPSVICAKGIEAGTGMLPLEIAADCMPDCPLAILSGPNFAHEVARSLPTAAVVVSQDAVFRDRIRKLTGTATFRLYGNDDPVGVQVGGAGKNVIAIAAGAVIGARLGENARAALVTRGLSELSRIAVALGGRAETVMGLSGLGDLLLTCTGLASRNFSFGLGLGEGKSVQDALASCTGVVEGLATAEALVSRGGSADMPICGAVASLVSRAITLDEAIKRLLSRPPRNE